MAASYLPSRPALHDELPLDPVAIECLPVPACLCGGDGRLLAYNTAAVALWGRAPDQASGDERYCGAHRLFRPDGASLPHAATAVAAALRTGAPVTGEEVLIERPDGSRIACLVNVNPLRDARGTVVGALSCFQDITEVARRTKELKDTVARLQERERQIGLLVQGVVDYAIFLLDGDGRILDANAGAAQVLGYARDEIVGRHFALFYSEEDRQSGLPARALAAARKHGRFDFEGWRLRKDGSRFWASVVIDAIRDESGALIGFAKVTRDMTEKRAVEEQLRQAQKMEAIGQLTAGIAHDFNNLLTVIVSSAEALARRLDPAPGSREAEFRRFTNTILRGAERAGTLTRQLLAFARQQRLDPQPVLLPALMSRVCELLQRTLGERIAVESRVAPAAWTVFVDPSQLESALLNLAVNARDAMPAGGRLSISASNVEIGAAAAAAEAELHPGEYVVIAVADSGTGMPPAVLAKAFEPFYTTKEVGAGTGLGLSQVYGFAKQSGGHASIASEVGSGTVVRLYLPRFRGSELREDRRDSGVRPARAGEKILLVEDNDELRLCSVEMLRELGYEVVEAREGASALRLLEMHRDVNLLFADLGLPGALDGRQVAERARLRWPALKVLLTTGYGRGRPDRPSPAGGEEGVAWLPKPFTYTTLSEKIREMLDDGAARPGGRFHPRPATNAES
ncbi:MAG TPA: PAS domain-containing protein [Alphaproteobacteria bacterium]|nr:PAS domain-containing protein [Alphaproteobacteria bacterium]